MSHTNNECGKPPIRTKKSSSNKTRPNEPNNSTCISHINLKLHSDNGRPKTGPPSSSTSYPTWKYISIRRNPLSNSLFNYRYDIQLKQKRINYFSKSFAPNLTNRSGSLDGNAHHKSSSEFEKRQVTRKTTEELIVAGQNLDSTINGDVFTTTITPVPSQNPSSAPSRVASSFKRGTISNKPPKNSSSNDSLSGSIGSSSSEDVDSNPRRSSGRHSCSVAEFNRFKNGLLAKFRAVPNQQSTPNFLLTYAHHRNNLVKNEVVNRPADQPTLYSRIRSIYEQVERDRQTNMSMVDAKRANYLNNLKLTHQLLSASLYIRKLNE